MMWTSYMELTVVSPEVHLLMEPEIIKELIAFLQVEKKDFKTTQKKVQAIKIVINLIETKGQQAIDLLKKENLISIIFDFITSHPVLDQSSEVNDNLQMLEYMISNIRE